MKNIIVYACLLFLSTGKVFGQGLDTAANTVVGPQITFVNKDTLYDFGGVPIGTVLEYQFEIRNTGNAPLAITAVKCESANLRCIWTGKSIKPGKKGVLTVTYTAHGDEGSFKDEIYITSNSTANPYPFIHITGAIIPAGGSYIPSSSPSRKKGGRGGR